MLPDVDAVLSFFSVPGNLVLAERYGSGLINDSFLCVYREDRGERKYLLQRINASVFQKPEEVMANVEAVASHVAEKLRSAGRADAEQSFPSLVPARSGRSFHRDPAGAFWRMFHFLEEGVAFDSVTGPDHAFEVGRALGRFQSLVSDLPVRRLHDTLPGFHHTPVYLEEYDRALHADAAGRAAGAGAECAFVDLHRALAPLLIEPMLRGEIPVRVVHNDPKVNNIMVDRKTGRALCMLDLDTVKPGIIHFDFGDCVRSAANPAGEDGEPGDVRFDLALFRAIAGGYLEEAGGFLTKEEVALLPASVKVITFELGIRFLADHLRGDTYFRVRHPGHNLHRARVQFRLLESIEQSEREMSSFTAQLARR